MIGQPGDQCVTVGLLDHQNGGTRGIGFHDGNGMVATHKCQILVVNILTHTADGTHSVTAGQCCGVVAGGGNVGAGFPVVNRVGIIFQHLSLGIVGHIGIEGTNEILPLAGGKIILVHRIETSTVTQSRIGIVGTQMGPVMVCAEIDIFFRMPFDDTVSIYKGHIGTQVLLAQVKHCLLGGFSCVVLLVGVELGRVGNGHAEGFYIAAQCIRNGRDCLCVFDNLIVVRMGNVKGTVANQNHTAQLLRRGKGFAGFLLRLGFIHTAGCLGILGNLQRLTLLCSVGIEVNHQRSTVIRAQTAEIVKSVQGCVGFHQCFTVGESIGKIFTVLVKIVTVQQTGNGKLRFCLQFAAFRLGISRVLVKGGNQA